MGVFLLDTQLRPKKSSRLGKIQRLFIAQLLGFGETRLLSADLSVQVMKHGSQQ